MKSNRVANARRAQLDDEFSKLRKKVPTSPKVGWIAEIRKSLLMTSKQLAKRLKVTQSVVAGLEKSERNRTITLKSLDRIAEALGCEVRYVLIPKTSLLEMLRARARLVLEQEEKGVERSMHLEGQGGESKFERKLEEAIEASWLIANKDKRLWDE